MSELAREKKAQIIDELEEIIGRCSIGILTDYRGISTTELTALRRQLGAREIGYRVVKNTLARLAAERAGKGTLAGRLVGPVALAYGYADITIPAKVLRDYLRGAKASLTITGGFVGSRLLTAEEVTTLATLPGREVLLAKVLGGMQAPIYGLANCLAAPLRGLAGVLRARIQQLEGA